MAACTDVIQIFEDGIRLSVRARPGLSRTREIRLVDVGEGKQAIEIAVAAAAQDGKANKAIIEEIARWLGVKKRDVSLKSGQTSRLKIIEISGEPSLLTERVKTFLH